MRLKLVNLVKLAKVVAFVVILVGSRLCKRSRELVGDLADWAASDRVGPPGIPVGTAG